MERRGTPLDLAFFLRMLELQLTLFLLIAVGIIIKKAHVVTAERQGVLSDIIINVTLPCNTVHAFLGELTISADFLKNCALAVILSALIQLVAIFGSPWLFRRWPRERRNVLSFGIICSNSSFIGMPMAQSLYGSLGVLYTSIFQIPVRFTMWSSGLALFTNVSKKDAVAKLIRHPCIVAIFVGFTLMLLPVKPPALFTDTVDMISQCTVPMSMITIGCILADANVKTLFSPAVLFHTLLRLVLFPLGVYLVLLPFPMDHTLRAICVIMTAMPVGSTTSLLAEKYHCDALFATQLTFVSTFLSIITIPAWALVLGG